MQSLSIKYPLVQFLASGPVSSIARFILGSSVPIFMLHRVYPDSEHSNKHNPAFLRRCLTYLTNRGYNFVTVADILGSLRGEVSLPKKSIAFTMDDGFYDQGSLAAPIFIEFNCPITIFLISGFLDRDLWPWYSKVEFLIENSNVDTLSFNTPTKKDSFSLIGEHNKSNARRTILKLMKTMDGDSIPEIIDYLERATQIKLPDLPPDNFKPMTWEMARELENAGAVFGPHTVSHPILSNVTDQQSQDEITNSWHRLNQELKTPSPVFCYPNGEPNDFGDREIKTLKKNGFLGAVSTTPGQVIKNSSDSHYLFRLPRYTLPYEFSDFIMYCSWIEYAKERIRGN